MASKKTGRKQQKTKAIALSLQQQTSNFDCYFCRKKMVQTEIYRCGSCLSDLQEGETRVFCENCILIHIRKGCEVVDNKGYTPQICDVHQNLCLMYCSDCETTFCFNCIGPHCPHRFMPASEKASEVRKEIFEALEKFDKLSKSMAFREADFRNNTNEIDELYSELTEEKLLDFFSNRYANEFSDHASELSKIFERKISLIEKENSLETVNGIISKAGVQVENLRKMLSLSDSVCISTFYDSKSEIYSSIKAQSLELELHTAKTWCNDLRTLTKSSIASALESWEVSKIWRREYSAVKLVNALKHKHVNSTICSGVGQINIQNVTSFGQYRDEPNPSREGRLFANIAIPCNSTAEDYYQLKNFGIDEYSKSDPCNAVFDLNILSGSVDFHSLVFLGFELMDSRILHFWKNVKSSFKNISGCLSVLTSGKEVIFSLGIPKYSSPE